LILLDTSGLLAAIDESQRAHADCVRVLKSAPGPLLLSPFVLAELDYLLGRYVGGSGQAALLEDVARVPIGWRASGPTTSPVPPR
jgi:hypothetical protein